MKFFFIIIIIIHLVINGYIFYRGWQAIPGSVAFRTVYVIVFLVLSLSFILAMLGRDVLPLEILKILYAIGTTWLACMMYFLIFFLITDLLMLVAKWVHILPDNLHLIARRVQVVASIVAVVALLIYGYIHFNNPVIENLDLKIAKKAGSLKSLRVVAVSDMHLGFLVDKGRLEQYVDKINSLHPDVILIAGDIIDNSARTPNEEHLYELLDRLDAPLGIYTCLGNHEYLSGIKESFDFLDKTKIKVLVDESVCVDSSFYVIGRDDRSNLKRKSLRNLVADVNTTLPIFLLDHQPYYLEDAQKNGIDLQFSGHTHDGQLWPGNLIVKQMYELAHGYKQKGNTHVYVSSGLALWGPLFRIGTQSEIIVFNIEFE